MSRSRILLSAGCLLLTMIGCAAPSTTAANRSTKLPPKQPIETRSARVVIDAGVHRHRVDPLIFGMHIEWVENGQGLLDAQSGGLRSEVLDLFDPLDLPLFRFPGGIHADYYDWRLGVGPGSDRGQGRNAFTRKDEAHRFGSPQFSQLLDATGARGLVTANFGTGSAQDAGAWAAYFRDNGGEIDLWEVGNETYLCDPKGDQPNGREIYRSPAEYAAAFPKYRKAIRSATPRAQVGAIAHWDSGSFPLAPPAIRTWSEDMLRALKGRADFIAVHNAYAPVILDNSVDFSRPDARNDAYRSFFAAAVQTAENLKQVATAVDRLSPINKGIPIAVTEFGPFFGLSSKKKTHAQYVDQTRTLAAALYTASVLQVLIDDRRVFMGCYTNPIHRWYGSLITDTEAGLITTPTYHLYALYRSRFESQLVSTTVDSPTFNSPQIGIVKKHTAIPDLIAQSSVSDDERRLTILLTNRSLDHGLRTTLVLGDFEPTTADCVVLTASSAAAINGPALSKSTTTDEEIAPRSMTCSPGPEIEVNIPPGAIVSLVAERG